MCLRNRLINADAKYLKENTWKVVKIDKTLWETNNEF